MRGIAGIVLAGVHRWDRLSLDRFVPRPLLPVANTPLICHALQWFRDAGVERAAICANSTSRHVRRTLGTGSSLGLALHYYEDWTPRGPAGCVRDAGLLTDAHTLVIIHGTIIPQADLTTLLNTHQDSGAALTVVTASTSEENPRTHDHLSPVGIYLVSRRALEHIPDVGYQDLKEMLIPRLRKKGESVLLFNGVAHSPRVSNIQSYFLANEWALQRLLASGPLDSHYVRMGEAVVHREARIASGARLIGPMLLGPRSSVGADATLIGPTVVGFESSIAPGAVVSRSVLWGRCEVEAGARIDRSVLPNNARVPSGSRLYNVVVVHEPSGVGPLRRMVQVDRPNGTDEQPGPNEMPVPPTPVDRAAEISARR